MQLALTTLALSLVPAAATDVWVIDDQPGPGVDFSEIDAAIAVANEGDIVLVRPGYYLSFTSFGKGLTVVGDVGGVVATNYTTAISGLGPQQEFLLLNLQFGNTSLALDLANNSGPVWVDKCWILGDGTSFPGVHDAMHVENCDAVVISRSNVIGVDAGGGAALLAEDSNIHAWDTVFDGGTSNEFVDDGGPGLRLEDGFLFASNCSFSGGDGTVGFDVGGGTCFGPGDGGDGLELVQVGAPTSAVLSQVSVAAGVAGSTDPGCPLGTDGQDLTMTGGATGTFLPTAVTRTAAIEPMVLRHGEVGTLVVNAAENELAFAALSASIAPVHLTIANGTIVPGDPVTILNLGSIPASNSVALPFTASVPPGVEGLVLKSQAFTFSATDGFSMATPAAAVMLASGF